MNYELTTEQLGKILDYLNGKNGTPLDMEAAKQLMNISNALSRALLQENYGLKGRNRTLTRQVERMRERLTKEQKALVDESAFDCTGLDSLDVAMALLYSLQQTRAWISKTKFMMILYMAYSSWLYHQNQRLFIETPQAIESGPIFWRVSGKAESVVTPVSRDWWLKLSGQSPAIAAFLHNYAIKYCNQSEADLVKYVTNGSPFRIAMENARKNGKKAWTISDKDIWLWKDEQHK